ncbi:MAG: thioredoxin family protein [Bdellovibrionales bacterium]|jgi:thioredoxin 1|nr:thioredoxin family protein [Bdellovibrionales bacterium]MBT3527451.1 thioredoxin family protein [Bdellovibrionales bacterium]MBT7668534.1 thioredoxin family protein [Bdellovibrionales bacterium]MBT7767823.1 thioredoxin family protein [Bdellovibrionales bacterium]
MVAVKELSNNNFEKVAKRRGHYLIQFSSPTCGPCKSMGPVMDKLATDNPDFPIYKVDTALSPELAQHFGIRSVPTFHFCKKRAIVYTLNGATPLGNLQFVINNLNDSYFLEHGEFKQPEPKKSYLFHGIIAFVVVALVLAIAFIEG